MNGVQIAATWSSSRGRKWEYLRRSPCCHNTWGFLLRSTKETRTLFLAPRTSKGQPMCEEAEADAELCLGDQEEKEQEEEEEMVDLWRIATRLLRTRP